MPTTAEILQNAPVACVLSGKDIANGSLFGQRSDPMLSWKIYVTYTIIKKIYDYDPNYPGIYSRALYLWELMNKYGIRAMGYSGGGSVAPITPTGSFEYLIPILGSDFTDATHYNDTRIVGKTIEIFWNDFNRFFVASEYETTSTGINVLIAGFDAPANPDWHFYIYIVNP